MIFPGIPAMPADRIGASLRLQALALPALAELPGTAVCAHTYRTSRCQVCPMAKQPKALKMLTHGQVWAALDRLAERAGLSPSGLARRAGLDPTTFNKSKRITAEGHERWPSTESLAKALGATGSSI